ncbi:ADP-forming succinate--CoA ligase subunit beta [Mesosutterella sp. OilRF-GAM-744-9]|uniref:Succinate--CoA ligase [ADP-forming] subunit beta n=1 Tax=Mesosutterella porci TaxID=2915351 RepID=A0ABS9MNW9_9BURK|nr:ADP-forming succinate--CoA ligase subunit beta [Mesosutterella sp. oilRF-744-WT-GAM-9]MCG5030314.1 ADP-forming succinate--CoA ligase subunit beta [Mesosutterella sp. oilRF-744-WT-GAM-9]
MKVYEYQAKSILAKYGVPLLRGVPVFEAGAAAQAAEGLSTSGPWVVKAQVHAGGRGKAGGVKIARSLQEVADISRAMLGAKLVTRQTGPAGIAVHRLYIEEACDIARELYAAILIDRSSQKICVLASAEGGMEIEELAEKRPEAIRRMLIDPLQAPGVGAFEAFSSELGLEDGERERFGDALLKLYEAFVHEDASLLEINPMVITRGGEVIALDAKLIVDDNALFRHPETAAMLDPQAEDRLELLARKSNLSYIDLDGDIACMVNGAGLAMATMDIIKLYGGSPANFLDVGGSATVERITAAFRIMLENPNIHAILINIFGGIMQCDIVAQGLVEASRTLNLKLPMVVRMHGTHEEEGHRILRESGLSFISAETMSDAAEKAVRAAREAAQ